MESDAELLRQYARNRNEAAFTELVSRHLNLVYAVACRETNGDITTAQDITQLVFIELARKARRLTGHTALAGWLYTSVRLVSANLRRAQQRRAARELNAQLMKETIDPAPPEPQGELLDGLLGDALHELGERDRGAVVLRFLEGHNLRDVGAALGLSEDAARMRVDRALEKLRKFLARRGIVSTASSITAALGAAAMPAQATIASTASVIAGTALKGAAATSTATSLLELFLGWMNLKAAAVAVTLLLAGGTTTALLQRSHATRTIPLQPALDESIWTTDTLSNLPPLVIIRPTKFTTGAGISRGARIRWRADTMKHLVAFAYNFDPHQVVLLTPLPEGKYDWLVTRPNPLGTLRRELKSQFNLTGMRGKQTMDVLSLQTKTNDASGLKPVQGFVIGTATKRSDGLEIKGRDIKFLASTLADMLKQPVINRTGITGKFDMTLQWDAQPKNLSEMNAALDQLGLELTASREPADVLIVKQAR